VTATQCTICKHPRRPEIEHAIANRVAEQRVAKRFNVGKYAVHRHKKNHLPPQLQAAILSFNGSACVVDLEALRKSESEGLLTTLIWQKADLLVEMDKARENMDPIAVSRFHDLLLKNTQTIAKLVGELASHTRTITNNFLIAPEYLQLRHAITTALGPFPEAAKAVSRALQALEKSPAPLVEHVSISR